MLGKDVFHLKVNPKDRENIDELYRIVEFIEQLYYQLPSQPSPDSLLAELNSIQLKETKETEDEDERVRLNGLDASTHLEHSIHACMSNILLLRDMMRMSESGGKRFSPYSIGPLARTAFVSACRVIFVLSPADKDEIIGNLQMVHTTNLSNYFRFAEGSRDFSEIPALQYVGSLPNSPSGMTNIKDGKLHKKTIEYVLKKLEANYPQFQTDVTLEQQFTWFWQVWSGLAHGWSWVSLAPQIAIEHGDITDTMPGYWPVDFMTLVSISHLALDQYQQALTQKEIDPVE